MAGEGGVSRREFLKIAAAGAIGLAIGLGGGYAAWGLKPQAPSGAAGGAGRRRVKALWIYIGPIGDYGWTRAHDDGRRHVQEKFSSWLQTKYLEKVPVEQAYNVIKNQLEVNHYDAVFATSWGYMEPVKRLAREYPNVFFYHCSGPWEYFRDEPNVATYFAEFYQLYYLCGIAAGAVTETCSVGYVPAFLTPEVVRHINAFALGSIHGAKLMGKCRDGEGLKIYVTKPLNAWFAPTAARNSARMLVDSYNVDVIAYTEDSTSILETAESYWDEGKKVYSFSHYSNMYEYFLKKGKKLRCHLTGQVADWTPIYAYLLERLYAGDAHKEDIWARLGDFTPIRWRRPVSESRAGKPEGAVYLAPINTKAIPPKAVYEIKRLYEDMRELLFEPFTGPIRGYQIDSQGRPQEKPRLKVPAGVRLGRNELWRMNWFYEKITPLTG
ncbi:MAG: BMP family ABC transporter substrate-binding protein [Crenarchaeota archaeon]|nr:BMP family ABC transporter substrate-binding protein [Thermoproteota archaeon]